MNSSIRRAIPRINRGGFTHHVDNFMGDPMEVALLVVGKKAGLQPEHLLNQYPKRREEAFDSQTKMMATIHTIQDRCYFAVKGAPEAVLNCFRHQLISEGVQPFSSEDRQTWEDRCQQMAQQGLRILAIASKTAQNVEAEPYPDLTLLGIFGLFDLSLRLLSCPLRLWLLLYSDTRVVDTSSKIAEMPFRKVWRYFGLGDFS